MLAEELDPATGRMLGNFPQAFSHSLINFALNLTRRTPRRRDAPQREALVYVVASAVRFVRRLFSRQRTIAYSCNNSDRPNR
jgi:hypothetical protein